MNEPYLHRRPSGRCRGLLAVAFLSLALTVAPFASQAQPAYVASAWWTYQQDCNGDGCLAGNLPGDRARLNWSPVVTGCNGSLAVFEVVSWAPCGSGAWVPIYTNPPHVLAACRSLNNQYVDLPMGSNCLCRDYQIELYELGQTAPDDIHSTNDANITHHQEQLLSQDFCLSDFFATCASLSGPSGSHADDNTYATKEPGEPNHAGNPGGKSLWYCWTAPTNAPVTFNTLGSTFDTLLAVYTGDTVSNLSTVACNDDIAGWTNRQSSVTFTPISGMTYHIAVDGFGGASGLVLLNWNQTGAALPDLIIWGEAAQPTVITRTFNSNDCEVVEGCEPVGQRTLLSFTTETRNIGGGDLIMGDPSTNSLYYWATCHQHWHFEQFCEYNLLDASNNIVATGHKVGFCLEDVHSFSPSASPEPIYNCTYQGIQSGWADIYKGVTSLLPDGLPCQYIDITGVPPGNYVLQIIVNPDNVLPESNTANNEARVPVNIPPAACIVPPINDDFANALPVTQTPFSYSEFNLCATTEPGEPNNCGNPGGHSVWFTWTPMSNHLAVINTKNSDFDTLLSVYTGNSLTNLTLIASNDDIIPGLYKQSAVSFPAIAGIPYQISVDGWGGAVGTVVLNVDPPGNDEPDGAYPLSGLTGSTNGSNLAASKISYADVHERAHAGDVGGHSVWYSWVAPASGPVDFNTVGSTFNTSLEVATGDGLLLLTNPTVVAANIEDPEGAGLSSRVDFYAQAGTNYIITIDGFGGAVGDFMLNWNMDSRLVIARSPGGKVEMSLTGVDWQRYTLMGSTDSLAWCTNFHTITLMGGVQHYTNSPASTSCVPHFYRAFRSP